MISELQSACHRLKIAEEKASYKAKETVAALEKEVSTNNDEKAWLLAESLIREQNLVDVYQILSLSCEQVQNRTEEIFYFSKCPAELSSCISTLIYCSKWLEIPELRAIRKQLRRKYGRKFVKSAVRNSRSANVNERAVSKLSHAVSPRMVHGYLRVFHEQVDNKSSKQIPTQPSNKVLNPTSQRGLSKTTNKTTSNVECNQLTSTLSCMPIDAKPCGGSGRMRGNVGQPMSTLSPILPLRVFSPNQSIEIAFDVRTRNPVYVMEKLEVTTQNTYGTKGQRPQFFEEKALPEEYRSRLQHYALSGYDRGHMAAAANFGGDEEKYNDTFTMCNVSPQIHSMNASIWSRLEHFCRRVAREETGGETHVVTGPLWLPDKVSKKHFQYNFPAIADSSTLVQVPTHFFKVVVVVMEGVIRKFACFVVPNAEVIKKTDKSLLNFVVQWEDVEIMSGLRFFPSLSSRAGWKDAVKSITRAVISKRDSVAGSLCDVTNNKIASKTGYLRLDHLSV